YRFMRRLERDCCCEMEECPCWVEWWEMNRELTACLNLEPWRLSYADPAWEWRRGAPNENDPFHQTGAPASQTEEKEIPVQVGAPKRIGGLDISSPAHSVKRRYTTLPVDALWSTHGSGDLKRAGPAISGAEASRSGAAHHRGRRSGADANAMCHRIPSLY